MKKITKQEEVPQVKTGLTQLDLNIKYAFEFMEVRPTNKVTYYQVCDYASEYKRKTGYDPSVALIVSHFTTDEDRKLYITR